MCWMDAPLGLAQPPFASAYFFQLRQVYSRFSGSDGSFIDYPTQTVAGKQIPVNGPTLTESSSYAAWRSRVGWYGGGWW